MNARSALSALLPFALTALGCDKSTSTGSSEHPGGYSSSVTGHAVEHLAPADFKSAAERTKGLYLDVRTPEEVSRGQLPGASSVDVNDPRFEQRVKLLDRHRAMFVYCASGGRSRAAAERLAALGFEQVFDLTGGITAWSRAGLPIVRPENGAPPAPTTTPAAFDAAILSARVVLVDFQTPWCGPCRELAPVMEVVEHDYAGRVTVLRVDVDSSEALATREHIEGVPLLALYVQGRETWRARGVASRDAIASQLDAALASTTPAAGERR